MPLACSGRIREGEDIVSAVNSFGAKDTLHVGEQSYEIYRLDTVPGHDLSLIHI